MQIHELNDYGGSLNSGAYLGVDNGTDTGKVSYTGLMAPVNARIDNIIAGGDAPSEAEVTDARLGANGVTYASLGDAIRGQAEWLEAQLDFSQTGISYALGAGSAGYVNFSTGVVSTAASGSFHSGKIQITEGATKLVVKNSFKYALDGIAIYDANNQYITGVGKDSFTDEFLIVTLPTGAYYFDVSWWSSGASAAVWTYDGKFVEAENSQPVKMSNVVNGVDWYSVNVFQKWSTATLTRTATGGAQYTTPTSGNTGFYGKMFTKTDSRMLYLFLDFTASDSSTLNIYLYGTSKAGVPGSFWKHPSEQLSAGSHVVAFDTNYIEVYGNIDTSLPMSILVANYTNTGGICTITKFAIGSYDHDLDSYYGETLLDTLDKFKEQIEEAKSVESVQEYAVSPNGTKYSLQVNNSGSIVPVPVVPPKTMVFGNSLLLGFNENYGINEDPFGMAASDKEHDYYALFTDYIHSLNGSATFNKFRTMWESAETDANYRAYTDQMLTYVDSTTDLIIVQLGDNINNDTRKALFPTYAKNLLLELRTKAPNARVAWVGAWFNSALIEEVMPTICKSTGCAFVSISDLNTIANQNVVGGKYYDSNGVEHTIESSGVASHPGDEGFRKIANRMLYQLGISDDVEQYTS